MDMKHEASSGRTNNVRKGVDASVWAVQLVEQRRNDRAGRKPRRGGARGHPGRSAQAGRPPLLKEPPGSRFLQASFPLLP
jgi:hypothetical protein